MADRTVKYRLEADIAAFRAQMAQASASTRKFAGDLTAIDKNGAKMRDGMTVVGGAAGRMGLVAAAGIGAATKAAMDWETAWAGVTKTTDGTAAQMATLEGELRELARTMPATHQEIAAVAEAAGQLGVERESVAAFTETMLQLGETTNLTADEAATSIAQMANVMRTAPDEIDNLGAALVALGNDGASTERDIIQMSQRISAAGAQIGLAESDILAIANAAASMGVEVEAGGTAISRVFTELAKATASGGPKLEAFAEVAGVSADEFRRLFAETPADAFAAFTGGLDRINKSGGDVFTTLKNLGMSDVRVSQALLGMAASGDLLTNSLELGREAWRENTALSDEFAKRLGTTASQVQVSWNNIKDAAIDAGAAMLPVVEGVAKTVSTLAGAFGALPGPVRGAAGGLLAVTAAAGGTVWAASKMVNAFASGRQALADLGVTSGKAKTDLDGVAASAGKADSKFAMLAKRGAGVLAVGTAVGVIADNVGRIDFGNLDRGLEALGRGEVTKDFRKVAEDIEFVTNKWNKVDLGEFFTAGGLFGDSTRDKAEQNIDAVDQKLAGLVETGERAKALELFEAISDQAVKAGASAGDVKDQFDAYALALRNAAGEADGAADANQDAADATGKAGGAADGASTDFAAMAKAQQEARKAARETATSFFNLGDSLNDSKVSLRGWIEDMAAQARALRNFRINAETAANRGLRQGLIQALREAGPEGARRMEQLANATESEIRKANRAWLSGQREINRYTDAALNVPGSVSTSVSLGGVPAALANLRRVRNELNATDGEVATAIVRVIRETRYRTVGNGPGQQVGGVPFGPADGGTLGGGRWHRDGMWHSAADGSTVPKTGLPYADRHLYLLADGEEIISNRYGQADRHRDLLKAINANRLAAGGTAGAMRYASRTPANVSVGAPSVNVYVDGQHVRSIARVVASDVVADYADRQDKRGQVGHYADY